MKRISIAITTAIAATTVLASGTAAAVSGIGSFEPGIYVSARGGAAINRQGSLDYSALDSTGVSLDRDRHDTNALLGIAFGRYLKNRPLRVELEASYQTEGNTSEAFELAAPPAPANGFTRQFISFDRVGVMGKLYLEHSGPRGSLFAFGGIGANYLSAESRGTTVAGGTILANEVLMDRDKGFDLAYSGGAGVTLRISPRHQIELMYEYMHIGDVNFQGDGTPVPVTTSSSADLSSHNLWIGYRFD